MAGGPNVREASEALFARRNRRTGLVRSPYTPMSDSLERSREVLPLTASQIKYTSFTKLDLEMFHFEGYNRLKGRSREVLSGWYENIEARYQLLHTGFKPSHIVAITIP